MSDCPINTVGNILTESLTLPEDFDISTKSLLGKGQFGITHKVKRNDKWVAIKEPYKDEIDEKETEMLNSVRHKNIVRFLGTIVFRSRQYIVMELADNGNLFNLLHAENSRRFPISSELKEKWIQDMAFGLEYLHNGLSYPILHGDVKSPNVLIFEAPRYTAKLSDFGLSEEILEGTYTIKGDGQYTARWAAPEAVRSKRTTKSDVWSYGALVWEILMEKIPHDEIKELYAIVFAVGAGKSPYNTETDHVSDKHSVLLSNCFHVDHSIRWNFKDVCRHLENPVESKPDTVAVVSETEKFGDSSKGEFYIQAVARFAVEIERDPSLIKKVKNLFKDKVPIGTLDRIKDGYDLINNLEQIGLVSNLSMEFLRERLSLLPKIGKRLASIFDDECTIDQFANYEYSSIADMGPECSGAFGDEVSAKVCSVLTDENQDECLKNDSNYQATSLMPRKSFDRAVSPRDRHSYGTGITEKTRFDIDNDYVHLIDNVVNSAIADENIGLAFDIIIDRVLKEHFWPFGRKLLGNEDYECDLNDIESTHTGQRERNMRLLHLWLKRQRAEGLEPTCEKLVLALKGAKLERTASDVEKLVPCPR